MHNRTGRFFGQGSRRAIHVQHYSFLSFFFFFFFFCQCQSNNKWELCNYVIITIAAYLKIENWASGVMFDQPSSMLTGKDVISHSSSVVLTNILFFLFFWSLEIYPFPLCCTHLRSDNDFGSRVAGESCGRPWLAMGAEWGWEVKLKVSRRCSRDNAVTFTPLDPKVHHADLAWRRKGFLGGQRMKIKLWILHGNERTVDALMLLFARQGDSLQGICYQPKCFSKRRLSVAQGLDALLMAGWLCWSLWCSSCGLWCCPAQPERPSWLHFQCYG